MRTAIPTDIRDIVAAVTPADTHLAPEALARQDSLTKPRGSLGRLEELSVRLYCIQGGGDNGRICPDPARIYTVAGDHGVTARGVSPYPQEVTRQMVFNLTAGGAGVSVLARTVGADLKVVDAGCAGGPFPEHPGLIQAKVMPGTADLSRGPAMTMEQCVRALVLGDSLAESARADGMRSVGLGDMGIGNTTPSTALYCAYLGLDPEAVTGPGAGLDAAGVRSKAALVRAGLAANAGAVASGDPVTVLAALGGCEIAALAGLALGAAARKMAVLVDGFIATAAFAAAWKMAPAVADYAFFAHASAEPGHGLVLEAMGQRPLLDLGMRLGEGTGAALALVLLRAAADTFNDMATFASAGVSDKGSQG